MRKIEVGRYNCPKCNADLLTNAVDFYFDGQTMSTSQWKCTGCHEEFYSVEQPYVATPDKSPPFMCPYCEQDAIYVSLYDDWSDYWKCIPCRVTFERCWMTHQSGIHTVNMYALLDSNLYVLRQYLQENKSRIDLLPRNLDDTVIIAKEFPYLLPSVIPINIKEKLKTYLVFS